MQEKLDYYSLKRPRNQVIMLKNYSVLLRRSYPWIKETRGVVEELVRVVALWIYEGVQKLLQKVVLARRPGPEGVDNYVFLGWTFIHSIFAALRVCFFCSFTYFPLLDLFSVCFC